MSEEIKELTDKEAMNIWSGNCGRVRSYQSVERQKEN